MDFNGNQIFHYSYTKMVILHCQWQLFI